MILNMAQTSVAKGRPSVPYGLIYFNSTFSFDLYSEDAYYLVRRLDN